jgi:5-formyltetrahydrofolate cyclo-ligase
MKIGKSELRSKMLEKRSSLSWQDVQIKSHAINEALFAQDSFREAKTILLYLPIKKEPNSLPIIKNAWKTEKQVLVPVTIPEKKELLLSRLDSLKDLTEGYYGIPEPKKTRLHAVEPHNVDLCLLPGVAFDTNGYRLGYGGGYFDRFLPKLRPDCLKIALAYNFQILESLEHLPHDLPVDMIITESAIYYCTQKIT